MSRDPADKAAPIPNAESWKRRLDAVSAAQSKYLWTLLAVGVFYWVAQPDTTTSPMEIPVLGIPLPADAILATAPAILFFIQLVIFGTMRAVDKVDQVLKPMGGVDESIDYHSNAIDWAVYTTDKSPKWATKLAGLSYALFMLIFTAEATYFLVRLGDRLTTVPHGMVLFVIAAFEAAVVYPFLLMHAVGRFNRFRSKQDLWEEVESK